MYGLTTPNSIDMNLIIVSGLAVCFSLCRQGLTVVAAGPHPISNESMTEELQEYIKQEQLIWIHLDLKCFRSIQCAVSDFSDKFTSLHYLINNAGVMLVPYDETEQGLEMHMGVNFIGHAYLTQLLLPALNRSSEEEFSPRVVNVASSVHSIAPMKLLLSGLFFENPPFYSSHLFYALSKLAIVLYTECLGDQMKQMRRKILVCSVHPGIVLSSLYMNVSAPLQTIQKNLLAPVFFRTIEQGAIPILNCVLDGKLSEDNCCYFENGTKSSILSVSEKQKSSFWKSVCQLIHRKSNKFKSL